MSTDRPLEVAVIGAGIGGTAAALALARRGIVVTVHERAAGFTEVGAGLQIGPNGVAVLDALGLGGAVRAAATHPGAVKLRDGPTGRIVATVPMGDTAEARYGRPYLQMHRADLLSILATAAQEAGVRFRFGEKVDPATVPDADAIIAADGVRSAFRTQITERTKPVFTGQAAWRALVPAARLDGAPLSADAHVFMGPGRHLVAYPLRGGALWNLVAVEERADWTAEGWNHSDDPQQVRAAFAGFADPARALLAAAGEVILWGLFAHGPLPRWQDGRRVLLGDACHPMLPFLAQGAVMALEDAWVLARELARDCPVPEALRAYEAARKPRASRVQAASSRNAGIYHMRARPMRATLHAGLAAASRLVPGRLLGRFDWLYGTDVTAT